LVVSRLGRSPSPARRASLGRPDHETDGACASFAGATEVRDEVVPRQEPEQPMKPPARPAALGHQPGSIATTSTVGYQDK
jgi:hypothetical protein